MLVIPKPIAYFPMRNSSKDWSGNNNHGVDTAIAYAKGAKFNGTSSRIATVANALLSPTTYTISLWVKPLAFSGSDANIFICNGTYPSQKYQFRCLSDASTDTANRRCLMVGWGDGSTWRNYKSSQKLSPYIWQHCVLSWDGTYIKIYYQGKLVSISTMAGDPAASTSNVVNIGAEVGGTNYFQGVLNEVMIFNKALTAQQINILYNYSRNKASYRLNFINAIAQANARNSNFLQFFN